MVNYIITDMFFVIERSYHRDHHRHHDHHDHHDQHNHVDDHHDIEQRGAHSTVHWSFSL